MSKPNTNYLLSALTILTSALSYFYSLGFYDIWILTWIAPIPILLFGLRFNSLPTFCVAFLSFLLGNSDILRYAKTLLPIQPFIIGVFTDSICYAIIILISCFVISKLKNWLTVFIFPSLWTTYEFINSINPASGTYGSIAYTQAHFLPFIQIASITGIWGITFLLCLIPSSLVVAYFLRKNKKQSLTCLTFSCLLFTAVLVFGMIRLNQPTDGKTLRIAALATPLSINKIRSTDPNVHISLVKSYIDQINLLKNQKIDIVILPEKIAKISQKNQDAIFSLIKETAKKNKIAIIAGLAQFNKNDNYNIAVVYSDNGTLLGIYKKQHMLLGHEDMFTKGQSLVEFKLNSILSGIAICKDMDFKNPAAEYGKNGVGILFVPALDFVIDEWLHARIAVLQGVQNGYAVVRVAQWGLLSASDSTGKIITKISTSNNLPVFLISSVNPGQGKTFYSKTGNWFAWILILISILLVLSSLRRISDKFTEREKNRNHPS